MASVFDGRVVCVVWDTDPNGTGGWRIGHCAMDRGVCGHVRGCSVGACVPAARTQAASYNLTVAYPWHLASFVSKPRFASSALMVFSERCTIFSVSSPGAWCYAPVWIPPFLLPLA